MGAFFPACSGKQIRKLGQIKMEDKIQLSPEQENALPMMLSGKNVFLTGEAGMGKTT